MAGGFASRKQHIAAILAIAQLFKGAMTKQKATRLAMDRCDRVE